MKKFSHFILLLSLSFSAISSDINLEGHWFGNTKYDDDKREVGILLTKHDSEADAYYAVVFEYLSYMEKGFVKKFLKGSEKNGYLKELFNWISVYKMMKIPGENKYALASVRVEDGKVVSYGINGGVGSFEGLLTLGSKFKKRPMKGSSLTLSVGGRVLDLKFKRKTRFPLKSTWDREYIPGPYNPGYKQAEVDVLYLLDDYSPSKGTGTAKFNVTELKGKSMDIYGEFTVNTPHRGMFTFTDRNKNGETIGADLIEDKIGIFIDVYNFKPFMKTDELVLIDPSNPYGSQMYFEEFGNKKELQEKYEEGK